MGKDFSDKGILYKHMIRHMWKTDYSPFQKHLEFSQWCLERIGALEGLEIKNGYTIGKIEKAEWIF